MAAGPGGGRSGSVPIFWCWMARVMRWFRVRVGSWRLVSRVLRWGVQLGQLLDVQGQLVGELLEKLPSHLWLQTPVCDEADGGICICSDDGAWSALPL